jgi:hypothetical protein
VAAWHARLDPLVHAHAVELDTRGLVLVLAPYPDRGAPR